MDLLKAQNEISELILDTPNRKEILKDGPPDSCKVNILGRGSYGVVFKAIYIGKQVAVKIMKNSSNGAVENEANILGWRHRNIVHLFKIESTVNYSIVIMERFPGKCLQVILDSIELPLEHRIYITLDITNALIYCHKRDIIHLDVKPQNVLVAFSDLMPRRRRKHGHLLAAHDRNYICKLCDFGSSFLMMSDCPQRVRGQVQGTVRYMSPEALKQDTLTPAADIFSLGVTMWQIQFRQLPYSWIECNDSVAYQVVKNSLRPNSRPPSDNKSKSQMTSNHRHTFCLCEHFSSEHSFRSIDHIQTILQKMKTLSPLKPQKSHKLRSPEKLKNQISRSLIGAFQNTFVELKNDLTVDEVSCEMLDEEFQDGFPLKSVFGMKYEMVAPHAENGYKELFMACWQADAADRPKAIDVQRRLVQLFRQLK